MSRLRFAMTVLSILLFTGAGCVAQPVSDLSPEQAAASLVFSSGVEIVLRPTVFGVGGAVSRWLGGEEAQRMVNVNEWTAGERATLSWSITTQVETEASKQARAAHDAQYAASPVGQEIPDAPKPVYEDRVAKGTISSESLRASSTLALPETWPEGDGGVSESSLVWLSRERYDELADTRKTVVSLGLFDESLVRVESATQQIKDLAGRVSNLVSAITGNAPSAADNTTSDIQSLITLEAESSWGEYALTVDGVRTRVRTIDASNAFASYTILANRDNPLILEIRLTPLAQGNLELLSRQGIAKGFRGYEVVRVSTTSAASNADQPRP